MHYRSMTPHETGAVCHLVAHVFCECVAPAFEPEGMTEFLRYLTPHEMANRLHHEHFVLVAEEHGKLVGMIEVRGNQHITLFFVDKSCQGRGIGRHLVLLAIQKCLEQHPELTTISVHATINAVPVYTRLGFRPVAPEQLDRGMRYLPMELKLRAYPSSYPKD